MIDLCERVAGAYCGQLLAGCGAEVTLIEPPEGHPFRREGPFVGGEPGLETSVPFLWFQQGKRSLVLDWETPEGRARLQRLVAETDVVLESDPPGQREASGAGFDTLKRWNPRLILVSITDFGQSGPYRDYRADELILEALSGQMYATGLPDREPLCAGVPVAQMMGGLHGFLGTLMALRQRERDGQARHVDVSNFEAGVESMELRAFAAWKAGKNPSRAELARPVLVPWGGYPCRDGWVSVCAGPFRNWRAFGRLLPGGALLGALYAQAVRNMERASPAQPGSLGVLSAKLRGWLQNYIHGAVKRWAARRTRAEILAVAKEQGLAFGSLRTWSELMDLPQHRARGFWVEAEHPVAGRLRLCRGPFPLRGWRTGRAPLLGEHQGQAAGDGEGAEPSNGVAQPGCRLPLDGVRILDLTLVEAAPHGSRILADFGAEVIKVEYHARLDMFRGTSLQNRNYDRQALWGQIQRNKRSLALDLRSAEGREVFLRLVETSDVVFANFRSGVLERLGFGYESLRSRKEDLILVTMPGYGDGGPDSSLPAFGSVLEMMSGVQNLTGYPGGRPERIREIDVLNGVAGASAVMAALAHRDRWGEGQAVDLSQMEATTHALMGQALLECEASPEPRGNRHGRHVPHGCYPCRGVDRWVVIAVRTEAEWRALAKALGREDWLADPLFCDAAGRRAREDAIDRDIAAWTRERDAGEVMQVLQNAGVAAAAVQDLKGVLEDPHLEARKWFYRASEGDGEFFMGQAFRISGIPVPKPRRGPDLGEANRDWLRTALGECPRAVVETDLEKLGTAFRPD